MKVPIPESEEQLIVDYIYLDFLIRALEEDRLSVRSIPFKIPEVYESLIDEHLKRLRADIVRARKQMRELKIKVIGPKKVNEDFVQYDYYAHGYEGNMRFWTAAMEYKGTKTLKRYFMSNSE
ncbi:hypothetical protein [Cytobacillus firmus]|uniref:Uncharacterized protein n=1 Tax=Cytobacillus firmus DS1 TaxID=1307436 RepID=W7LA02_CYTFI|nr:hypothetical protein [Cytobacillus firmus]EWG08619.1 hypothetical protein PBF_23258 [Cytobacillus firmus DS1]